MGEIRSEKAISVLERAFQNETFEIKLWAALGLSKIGKAALPALHRLLTRAISWQDRVLILDALDKIGDPGSGPYIAYLLEQGSEEEISFIQLRQLTRLITGR